MMGNMGRLGRRPSYANVVATVALFLAIGGGGFAIAALSKNSVGSKQIKAGAVGAQEIANEAVSANKLRTDAVAGTTFTTESDASTSLAATPSPVMALELPQGSFALVATVDLNTSGSPQLVTCGLDVISASKNSRGDFLGHDVMGADRLFLSGAAEMKPAKEPVAGISRGAAILCAAEGGPTVSARAAITAIPTGSVEEIEH